MSQAIDMSAPTVIVTLLIGASLAGLAGALIALPIAAALKVLIREVWLSRDTAHATPSPAAGPDDVDAPPSVPPPP